jgi:hypothetical protein
MGGIMLPQARKGFQQFPVAHIKEMWELTTNSRLKIDPKNAFHTEQITRIINKEPRESLGMIILQKWIKSRARSAYVTPNMFEALQNTEVLKDTKCDDFKKVFPVLCFVPPVHTLNTCIWVAYVEKDKVELQVGQTLLNLYDFVSTDYDTILFCFYHESQIIEVGGFTLKPGAVLQDVINGLVEKLDASIDKDNSAFRDWYLEVCKITFNLLLLCQEYPEYLRTDSVEEKMRDYNDKTKIIKVRNQVIGSNFNLRPTVKDSRENQSVPTGRSVIAHWRRGHWRRQTHGLNYILANPEAKIIENKYHMVWIKPVFVNKDEL